MKIAMNENQTIRGTYGMQELAQLYFPHNTPASATTQLKRWMNKPALMLKLQAANYLKGQRILTPRQVDIIVDHLGDP